MMILHQVLGIKSTLGLIGRTAAHALIVCLALFCNAQAGLAQDTNGNGITDKTVESVDIRNNSIQSIDIATGAVTSSDIANGTITGTDITNGSVASADIRDNSVTGTDIRNGTVTTDDIQNTVKRVCCDLRYSRQARSSDRVVDGNPSQEKTIS